MTKKISKSSKKTSKNKPVKRKSEKRVVKKKIKKYEFKRRPLPASFMIIGLFGLIVSAVYTVSARLSLTWGFMFMVFFLILFISALVSLEPNKGEV